LRRIVSDVNSVKLKCLVEFGGDNDGSIPVVDAISVGLDTTNAHWSIKVLSGLTRWEARESAPVEVYDSIAPEDS
jgi:hypothetical protein